VGDILTFYAFMEVLLGGRSGGGRPFVFWNLVVSPQTGAIVVTETKALNAPFVA
jgi:hypothetical protein